MLTIKVSPLRGDKRLTYSYSFHEACLARMFPFGGGKITGVDEKRCSGDAGGVFAGEIKNGFGDVARRQRNAHGHAAQALLQCAIRIGSRIQVLAEHRRIGDSGTDTVATDTVSGVVEGD